MKQPLHFVFLSRQIPVLNESKYRIFRHRRNKLVINLIHGKLRTPKNKTFNKLIDFINIKYYLNIQESILDKSDLVDNSWFTGLMRWMGTYLSFKTDTRLE
jgi:hypothetical protein